MLHTIRSFPRPFVLIVLMLALLAGCASMAPMPSAEQQANIERIETLEHRGEYQSAAQQWELLAEESRGTRAAFLLRAAEAWRQLGAWDRASPVLDRIDLQRLDPAQIERFDLLRAELALETGNTVQVLALTANSAQLLSPSMRARSLELRARAQAAAGTPIDAARTRLQLDGMLEGFDREQNQQQLLAILQAAEPQQLMDQAASLPIDDPLRVWVSEALAASGRTLPQTLPELNRPVGTLLTNNAAGAVREGYQRPAKVALLLPSSGPLARAAAAVRDGFLTAFTYDPVQVEATKVAVYDSGSSAFGAVEAYQQAVSDGVDVVVGPLDPASVSAVFQLRELPVPVLALNHAEGGLPPPGSAEFSLPPEAEAAQAAARMIASGLYSALSFVAEADWAQRSGRAFRAQFESLGGHVIGSATLPEQAVNYADAIAALSTNVTPDTGIFVALRPRQGRLLIPQLEIAGLLQPVFATSHIYGAEPNQGLDRDLNGVQFSDSPWLFNDLPGIPSRSALQATAATTIGPAARLFAFGLDAWTLLPYLDWLREHPGSYLQGATGQLTMDSFGRVHRTPLWLHFVNGIAVPMSGGLSADSAAVDKLSNDKLPADHPAQ